MIDSEETVKNFDGELEKFPLLIPSIDNKLRLSCNL